MHSDSSNRTPWKTFFSCLLSLALTLSLLSPATAANQPSTRAATLAQDGQTATEPQTDLSLPVALPNPATTLSLNPGRYGPYQTLWSEDISTYAYSPWQDNHTQTTTQTVDPEEIRPDRVLIKLADHSALTKLGLAEGITSQLEELDALAELGVTDLEPIFSGSVALKIPYSSQTASSTPESNQPDLSLWFSGRLDASDPAAAIQKLAQMPEVAWAEPEFLYHLTGSSFPSASVNPDALSGTSSDPYYAQQWYLEQANVPAAWAFLESQGLPSGGRSDVVVAVVDTGIDLSHPDLVGNLWVNLAEQNGQPGVDDDNNGYIDDLHGANTHLQNGNPQDDLGHGTHVAGIIGATADNGIGGVGVAYNTRLMAVKVSDYSTISTTALAAGITYAAQNGADVINMSLGGGARSQLVEEALVAAFSRAVLVASAGNNGVPNPPCLGSDTTYPANFDWVLGVMASDSQDSRASFSNWDCVAHDEDEYEIMAPGVDILSTIPGGGYAAWDGTSMAAPIISGIAALARSYWPDTSLYSGRFIMGQIASTGNIVSQPDGGVLSRVNALNVLNANPTPHVKYMAHWTFDSSSIAPSNDNDGIVDSGETIDLGIRLHNHWGVAGNVTASLQAIDPTAVLPDPYISFLTDTVNYGAIGSFSWDDNGITYDEQGDIYVEFPFRFTVAPETPNNHIIPMRLTVSAENGMDLEDPEAPYTWIDYFYLVSQKAEVLPRYILEDMVLDKNHLWIANGTVDISARVTVMPGTQILCGMSPSDDPWAPPAYAGAELSVKPEGALVVQGTADEPVEIFPNPQNPGDCEIQSLGLTSYEYLKIEKPDSNIANEYANHVLITPGDTAIGAALGIGGSLLRNVILRNYSSKTFYSNHLFTSGRCDTCLLNQGPRSGASKMLGNVTNSVILNNNLINNEGGGANTSFFPNPAEALFLENHEGHAYFLLFARDRRWAQAVQVAELFGGYPAAINTPAENTFLMDYLTRNLTSAAFPSTSSVLNWITAADQEGAVIGLVDDGTPGSYTWQNGEPLTFNNNAALQGYGAGFKLVKDGSWKQYVDLQHYINRWTMRTSVYLIEVETELTQTMLDSQVEAIRAAGAQEHRHNAYLDSYWNPPVDGGANWMDFSCDCYLYGMCSNTDVADANLSDNFFGGAPVAALNYMIHDVNDDMMLKCRVVTEPQVISESTYPYVVSVQFHDSMGNMVTTVAKETLTFTVTFNRDMDTTVEPLVTFGPDYPYSDFRVQGEWINPRVWQGQHAMSELHQGHQYMYINGAVAASDSWLVTGDDFGRFTFEVSLQNTAALMLQASGVEHAVQLEWQQDDFDLLAGYHIYRMPAGQTEYTRLTTRMVPADQKNYMDETAVVGQRYYYKYSVVTTDMQEAFYSNSASATAIEPVLEIPTLVHPADGASIYTSPVQLSWNTVTGANAYQVQISSDSNFADVLSNFTADLAFTWHFSFQPGNVYYWRVKANGPAGGSLWSPAQTFLTAVLPAPTLVSPLDDSHLPYGSTIDFSWQAVASATGYNFQLCNTQDCSNPLFNQPVSGESYTLPQTLAPGEYHWRVQTYFGEIESPWSNIQILTVNSLSVPTLLSPFDDNHLSYGSTISFNWLPVAPTTGYRFQLCTTQDCSNPLLHQSVSGQFYLLSQTLAPGEYHWRVQALDGEIESPWSNIWTFTVDPLPKPVLLAPTPGEGLLLGSEISFNWQVVEGASDYEFQLCASPYCDEVLYEINTSSVSFIYTNVLNLGNYAWRVKASDGSVISEWSNIRTFTIDPLSAPTLVSPLDDSHFAHGSTINFSWQAVASATGYSFQLCNTQDCSNPLFNQPVGDESYVLAQTLVPGVYHWRVQAHTSEIESSWSVTLSFQVDRYKVFLPLLSK